jgi:hypothetical protein
MSLGLVDVHPVRSSILFISYPLLYYDEAKPGWIHTSYDNSTSTATLGWVNTQKLEDQTKVAALTILRVSPSSVFNSDINLDGVVNIVDVTIVAKAFGSESGDPNWSEQADLDRNGVVNIIDVTMVARDFGKEV